MPITWDQAALGTGLPDIDEQHMEWIRRYNDFERAVKKGEDPGIIFNTLAYLVQYTEMHFSHEEARMEAFACPALEENRAAHKEFKIKLNEIFDWLEHTRPTAVEMFLLKKDLDSWLKNHISTIDIQLRMFK